jgi:uncharacterized protein YrrD
MQFKEDAVIYSASGEELGRLDRVVLEPASQEVTHVILRKGWFFPEDRVIPVELISSANENEIRLVDNIDDLGQLPLFEETHYIDVMTGEGDQPESTKTTTAAPSMYWYPPISMSFGYPGYYRMPFAVQTERNLPEDAVPMKDGARVIDSQGDSVGSIERVITGNGERVTHVVISSGLLTTTKKLIPSSWIFDVQEDEVQLAVPSDFVDRLPDYEDS